MRLQVAARRVLGMGLVPVLIGTWSSTSNAALCAPRLSSPHLAQSLKPALSAPLKITGVTRSHGEVEDWDADFLDEEEGRAALTPTPSPGSPSVLPTLKASAAPEQGRLAAKVRVLRRASMRYSGEQFAQLLRLRGASASFAPPTGPLLPPSPLRHLPEALQEAFQVPYAHLMARNVEEAVRELQAVQERMEGSGAVCAWLLGRAALMQGDPFKAQRSFKQALGELNPHPDGLHAQVLADLALRLEEERAPGAVEARLQHVAALGGLSAWDEQEAASAVRSLLRLAEHSEPQDADLGRAWRRHARAVCALLPPEAVPDLRALLRQTSQSEPAADFPLAKVRSKGDVASVVEEDEASDWDLELDLDLEAPPPSQPTLSTTTRLSASRSGGRSGSESDWDKEFAASEEEDAEERPSSKDSLPRPRPSLPGRSSLQRLLAPPTTQDVRRYSLLPGQGVKTVKFPPPTALWTLKTKENHKFMSETQLHTWLTGLQMRQEELLQSKNQPPSLKDLDLGTDVPPWPPSSSSPRPALVCGPACTLAVAAPGGGSVMGSSAADG